MIMQLQTLDNEPDMVTGVICDMNVVESLVLVASLKRFVEENNNADDRQIAKKYAIKFLCNS